jgi:hypothetical protein
MDTLVVRARLSVSSSRTGLSERPCQSALVAAM